jgi:hypothetical protein
MNTERPITKQPIGPEPEWIWREKRMWHLIERLAEYANQTTRPAQEEWLAELRTRIHEVLFHNVKTLEPEVYPKAPTKRINPHK